MNIDPLKNPFSPETLTLQTNSTSLNPVSNKVFVLFKEFEQQREEIPILTGKTV